MMNNIADELVSALYEYMLRVQDDEENDLVSFQSRSVLYPSMTNSELVDWFECILRVRVTRDIFADLFDIIRIYRNKDPT